MHLDSPAEKLQAYTADFLEEPGHLSPKTTDTPQLGVLEHKLSMARRRAGAVAEPREVYVHNTQLEIITASFHVRVLVVHMMKLFLFYNSFIFFYYLVIF